MRRLSAIVLLLAVAYGLYAQKPSHLGTTLTTGRVIPINGSPYENFTPEAGIDLQIYWQQNDSRYWTQYWRHPFFGLHVGYAHLFDTLVGDRIEFAPLLQAKIWHGLSWNISYGFSIYTNPYRRSHYEDNGFIGSYLNCLLTAGLLYDINLNNGSSLYVAGRIVHSSNGNTYRPNHGLNLLQLELGYRFPLHQQQEQTHLNNNHSSAPQLNDFNKLTRPYLSIAPSLVNSRTGDPNNHTLYFAYSAQLGLIRHAHPAWSYGINTDLMYNYSHQQDQQPGDHNPYFGLSAFGEAHWGQLTMRLGAGHYLDYYRQNWEQWYIRLGGYWNITERQRLGVAMKLHYDHIDYIEWTYMIELF